MGGGLFSTHYTGWQKAVSLCLFHLKKQNIKWAFLWYPFSQAFGEQVTLGFIQLKNKLVLYSKPVLHYFLVLME